jgi:YHS domain-containing protein
MPSAWCARKTPTCVDVDLDAKTPFTDYNGKRYYFCSDDCRSEFQKDPAKFAKAK